MDGKIKKWIAVALVIAITLMPLGVFAEEFGSGVAATCDEAYYGMLDYYGNLQEGSIVKSYVLNGADTIKDYGKYDEVVNLTDDTEPTYENGVTTFKFKEGSAPDHFYFQGTTTEPYEVLPWTISLQYQLNGVKTAAEDLAGEKGVVTVELNIVPNDAASQYAKNNYILMATTMFNQNDILSLKAEGAQVQLVGNLRTVIFAAMPGEERHFTMEVGTDSFEFMGFTFLVLPATLAQLDMLSELQEDKDDIEENYKKLKGSIDETLDAMQAMAQPLRSSAEGLDELNSARAILSSDKDTIYDDVDRANADLQQFIIYIDPLYSDLEEASKTITEAKGELQSLMDTTNSLKTDISDFQDLLKKTKKDTENARKNTKDARANIKTLQKDLKDLKTLVKNIQSTRSSVRELRTNLSKTKGISQIDGVSADTAQIKQLIQAYETLNNDTNNARTYLDALYNAGAVSPSGIDVNKAFVMVLMQNMGITQEQAATLATAYAAQDMETLSAMAAAFGMDVQTLTGALGQAYTGAQTMASQLTPLVGVYLANGGASADFSKMSFKTFVKNILIAQGSSEASAEENASVLDLLYSYSKNGEDIAAMDALIDEMGGAIVSINDTIDDVNSQMDSIKDPTVDLLKDVEDALKDMDVLLDLIDDADDTADSLQDATEDIDELLDHVDEIVDQTNKSMDKGVTMIDQLDDLHKTLNDYEPTLQKALKNMQNITTHSSAAIRNLSMLIDDTQALAKKVDGPLDSGTEKSLTSLSLTLRKTADAMDTVKNVRSAKDTLTSIIEDIWDEHSGDLDNLLNMDNKAAPQSLTSTENPTPTSIQYMIRSQEIKIDDTAEKEAEAAALKKKTFFGRVGTMFQDIGSAFTNAFK